MPQKMKCWEKYGFKLDLNFTNIEQTVNKERFFSRDKTFPINKMVRCRMFCKIATN